MKGGDDMKNVDLDDLGIVINEEDKSNRLNDEQNRLKIC